MRLLQLLQRRKISLALIGTTLLPMGATVHAYEKATDSTEVVLDKLFPKKHRLELDGKGGIVLNSSYTQSFLLNGGLTYFWSEEWGFNLSADLAMVKDKSERQCIENFYNDPNYALSSQCGDSSGLTDDQQGDANFGPAYVPIRKLKYMFTGNFVWNPIYGKQIFLLSATNYFDFFISFGGGLAMSDYYPLQTNFVTDGHAQRGTFVCTKKLAAAGKCDPKKDINPGTSDLTLIGIDGRPLPKSESNILAHVAIGQRYHFFKRFILTASLENYTILGTEQGFDNFLTIMAGAGVRF